MSAPPSQAVQAFRQLPKKLQDFFKLHPPAPFRQYAATSTLKDAPDANPFLPNIHPVTKVRHDPIYSLRRQSDLYKLAHRYGIADLMPPLMNGKKFFEEKYATKKPMKGATRYKGHKHENNREARQKEIAEAVARADEIIAEAKGKKYLKRKAQKEEKNWF